MMTSGVSRQADHIGYNIQYADSERRALLGHSDHGHSPGKICSIVVLSFVFCTGITIGTYLIITEDITSGIDPTPFVFISRSGWDASPATKFLTPTVPPMYNVLITQTHTKNCDTQYYCSKAVHLIQEYDMNVRNISDIGYNFLIGGDGATYEGTGWELEPQTTDSNRTLVIGFIGRFVETPPSPSQVRQAKALLKRSVRIGKMDRCFTVMLRKEADSQANANMIKVVNQLKLDDVTTNHFRCYTWRGDCCSPTDANQYWGRYRLRSFQPLPRGGVASLQPLTVVFRSFKCISILRYLK